MNWRFKALKMTYKEYINSPKWDEVKRCYYRTHPKKCFICGTENNIDLHHKTYTNLGHEREKDLIPLCREHHKMIHDDPKVNYFERGTKKNKSKKTKKSKISCKVWGSSKDYNIKLEQARKAFKDSQKPCRICDNKYAPDKMVKLNDRIYCKKCLADITSTFYTLKHI